MKRDPRAYLLDVQEAVEAVQAAVAGITLEPYEQSRLVRPSVARECILIGEAHSHEYVTMNHQVLGVSSTSCSPCTPAASSCSSSWRLPDAMATSADICSPIVAGNLDHGIAKALQRGEDLFTFCGSGCRQFSGPVAQKPLCGHGQSQARGDLSCTVLSGCQDVPGRRWEPSTGEHNAFP